MVSVPAVPGVMTAVPAGMAVPKGANLFAARAVLKAVIFAVLVLKEEIPFVPAAAAAAVPKETVLMETAGKPARSSKKENAGKRALCRTAGQRPWSTSLMVTM